MATLLGMGLSAVAASQQRARLALVGVAAAWGMTFVLTKVGIRRLQPATFVFARFAVATLGLLPWMTWPRRGDGFAVGVGVLLGVINVVVHLLQATALMSIGAARAAFLAGAHLLFVPPLEALAGLGKIGRVDVAAIALCLTGLYLLTGADLHGIGGGDLFAIGAELSFAVYMITAALAARRHAATQLVTGAQMATTATLAALLAGPELAALPPLTWPTCATVVVCGLLCTLAPIWAQMHFQPRLRPSHAALIISLEPLFAGALALLLLDEAMTATMLTGAAVMLSAAFLPALAAAIGAREASS